MRTPSKTYPLRLPASIKAEAERLAAADGVSFNQFAATAIAEKVGALTSADFLRPVRARRIGPLTTGS